MLDEEVSDGRPDELFSEKLGYGVQNSEDVVVRVYLCDAAKEADRADQCADDRGDGRGGGNGGDRCDNLKGCHHLVCPVMDQTQDRVVLDLRAGQARGASNSGP